MSEDFTITIASDADHEKVFAEIYYLGKYVALISQEQGLDRLKVEFPSSDINEAMIVRAVDMEGLQQALISLGGSREADRLKRVSTCNRLNTIDERV